MTRIQLLKLLDSSAGAPAIRLAARVAPRLRGDGVPTSILFIRPGGIGDAVHLIPAINAVKAAYPGAVIDILAERRNSAIFGLCPHVRTLFRYDLPVELLRALHASHDVVIDTEQWHRLSAVMARLTRAPVLIGYATNERCRMFTHPVAYSHDDYEVESFFHLLAPLGIEHAQAAGRFLAPPAMAAVRASMLLESVAGMPFVVLFPGASIEERKWGAGKFRRVAELLSLAGFAVVVVGGGEDRDQGDRIIGGVVGGGVGINLAGRTSLTDTAAVIDASSLLVSGDSGVLHIAAGLGKPTVSLFGPGRAKKWAPRGERHIVINRGLSCSPCTTYGTTPPCPHDARCMGEIGADEVFRAAMLLLRGHK